MEQKEVNKISSLLVPCVQELAKESMTAIPARYIRPHQDQPMISDAIHSQTPQVPVIDMHKLLSLDSMDSELDSLHFACKEWGFFQLVNHGVSSLLVEKMKIETQDFFDLPMEEKKIYWQYPGEVEGFGQNFVASEEQKLDWGDLFVLTTQPIHLRKPHLFPKLPLPIRSTLDAYSSELKDLAIAITAKIAKALKMELGEMREFFDDGMQMVRMNYYPPCPQPEKVIGLSPHADGSGLTILLQVNEVEGLQIRKDGMWMPVKPLPNAFIVNIGDMMEMITNGAYRSIEHRATVNSLKARLSIATFYMTRYEGEVGPASSLITQHTPALFKRVTVKEYLRGLFARELDGKSYLDTLRIRRVEHQDESNLAIK
ncbi:2OG-FeII_Oxy domain-containing protein/DIOX_N domain-containing protein [Cephalotus follicularis]|uniref:2OG-FeII_Oxy domain-containing protein/DIOX_N domain-containing protein n=1 Tax=Cephalotus follicularis TaxID=3775 RepID=A0A1Q3AY43_CEPFO|nr:2OG-FeII_Oxy domain-containing protein/DIOX_N domain-containing protein [Cephalotus follicularis]